MSASISRNYLQSAASFQAACRQAARSPARRDELFRTYHALERTFGNLTNRLTNRSELARVQAEHAKVVRAARSAFPERLGSARAAPIVLPQEPIPPHLPIDSAQTKTVRELRTALCRRAPIEECFNHFRKLDKKVQFRCYELLFRDRITRVGIDRFLANPKSLLPILNTFGDEGLILKALLEDDEVVLEEAFQAFTGLHPHHQMRCYELLCRDIIIREGVDKFLENPSALLQIVTAEGVRLPIIHHLLVATKRTYQSPEGQLVVFWELRKAIASGDREKFAEYYALLTQENLTSVTENASQLNESQGYPYAVNDEELVDTCFIEGDWEALHHVFTGQVFLDILEAAQAISRPDSEDEAHELERSLFETAQELVITLSDDTIGKVTTLYRAGKLNKTRISPELFTDLLITLKKYQSRTRNRDYLRVYPQLIHDVYEIYRLFVQRMTTLWEEEDLSNPKKKKDLEELMVTFPELHHDAVYIKTTTFHPPRDPTPEVEEALPGSLGQSRYDRQIVFSLLREIDARGIAAKGRLKGIDTDIIELRRPGYKDYSPLRLLTTQSRLYIDGHGSPGTDDVSSDHGVHLTCDDIVRELVRHAPHLRNQDEPLRVSVGSCYGGKKLGAGLSFAQRLSFALDRAGIYAEVLGRTGPVPRWDGRGVYRKRVSAPDTKLCFVTRGGLTRITNAYTGALVI